MPEELKTKPTTTPCKSSEAPATCDETASSSDDRRFKVVVVGHVDHGKSTLLGRWMIEAGKVAADQISKVEKICNEKGLPFEPAFLLDAFEEEQSQGLSIDSTRAQLEFNGRRYLFIDAPGHHEFLKNMTSGASNAELGILLIDAAEGIQAQTSTHLKILSILGIPNVVVAVNKIDKIGYNATAFEALRQTAENLVTSLELNCKAVVPISALSGENVVQKSETMKWYDGHSLLESISFCASEEKVETGIEQFRMLLQDVYKLNDERYFLGKVISGSVQPGDRVFFSPSGKSSKVHSIARFPDMNCPVGIKGQSIALKLSEQIFVERGEVISPPDQAPETDTELRASLVWMSPNPLSFGSEYLLKLGTAETACSITPLDSSLADQPILNGAILDVLIKLSQPVAFDRTGATGGVNNFVICSPFETVGAGAIDFQRLASVKMLETKPNIQREGGYLERAAREEHYGHKGTVLWMTGLSGSGKSTLAKAMEQTLFKDKRRVLALDADTLRTGLCADLGFSPAERSENIRRIAEVAKLCANMGCIVLVACLSPYRKDREMARTILGDDFNEVFISCPVEICQSRDPKGLYNKAATGTLKSFSGLDSPYQIPIRADLTLDSSQMSLESEVQMIMDYLRSRQIID